MSSTAVNILLSNIHCSDEADGIGTAEPYLWTVFFKVDGDTATVDATGHIQGTATVVGTAGNHGDLGTTDVDAGDDVPIPLSLGFFSGFVKEIPTADGHLLPGVIGYAAILVEQDCTPDSAIAAGHAVLNQSIQSELNALIPTLTLADLTNLGPVLDNLKHRVQAQVEAEIRRHLSVIQKLENQDDFVGTDVGVFFANNDEIGTDPLTLTTGPIPIQTQFNSEGSWTITGSTGVVPSRQVFLKIVGRSSSPVPVVGSGPLPGVAVQLFELDNPAPAGDDVVIPPVGETEQIVGFRDITDSASYAPAPDQLLGTQTTDAAGVAAFQVWPNRNGGTYMHTRTIEDLRSGKTTTTTTHTVIPERLPDYGVTVVGHSGKPLATRQLVRLNAAGNVGTPASPVIVIVDRDEPVVFA
jgi:hypothetical protein